MLKVSKTKYQALHFAFKLLSLNHQISSNNSFLFPSEGRFTLITLPDLFNQNNQAMSNNSLAKNTYLPLFFPGKYFIISTLA